MSFYLRNVHEVVQMAVETMMEDGEQIGTLKRMIEHDAQWTEDDLKRLKLLK